MADELILEKQKQAIEILNEKNIDMWLTFVRETGNIKDPMLDMIVGTGATWHSAFILTKSGESIAIIGSLEEANMKTVGTFKTIIPYLKSIREDFIKTIERINPKKIAINYSQNSSLADGLTHGVYLELVDILKETPYADKFVSSEEVVAALRGRKSEVEISYIKEAIRETLIIFDQVTDFIEPGKSELDVADFVKGICKEKGFDLAWDEEHCPAVFTGPDTAGAHSGPTNKKIERGHVINMDFGIKLNGYCSDLQRTWYVLKDGEAEVPTEVNRGFKVIVDSIQKSFDAIKPGKKGWEIDEIARSYIVENGYEEYPHGLGHQVGRVAHDGGALFGPRWERYGNIPYLEIEKNNVFTIEPRLPIKDYGIATIEEIIVVKEDGAEYLSKPQKEIYVIR
ncbi:MAG: Xaa-Pro peptidase family protein [Melioribacteraceae bacterium]|nr:Xaa-Pro peptidase family protein [Melioribacteraceae bacterium]